MKTRNTFRNLLVAGALTLGLSATAGASDTCPADVTGDGLVTVDDVTTVFKYWGTETAYGQQIPSAAVEPALRTGENALVGAPAPVTRETPSPASWAADCDRNGIVDVADLIEVIMAWGKCPIGRG